MSANLLCRIAFRIVAITLCFGSLQAIVVFTLQLGWAPMQGMVSLLTLLLQPCVPLLLGVWLWFLAPQLADRTCAREDTLDAGALTERGLLKIALQLGGVYLVIHNLAIIASTLFVASPWAQDFPGGNKSSFILGWMGRCGVELCAAYYLLFHGGKIARWITLQDASDGEG